MALNMQNHVEIPTMILDELDSLTCIPFGFWKLQVATMVIGQIQTLFCSYLLQDWILQKSITKNNKS